MDADGRQNPGCRLAGSEGKEGLFLWVPGYEDFKGKTKKF